MRLLDTSPITRLYVRGTKRQTGDVKHVLRTIGKPCPETAQRQEVAPGAAAPPPKPRKPPPVLLPIEWQSVVDEWERDAG
jgi:hypothetical protein